MITLDKRRLNARYYAGPVQPKVDHSYSCEIQSAKGDEHLIKAWIQRVVATLEAFVFPCQVRLTAIVHSKIGFSVDGTIETFDEASYDAAEKFIVKMYDVFRDYPRTEKAFRVTFKQLDAKTIELNLQTEGYQVRFEELDTERKKKKGPPIQKTVPSPILN